MKRFGLAIALLLAAHVATAAPAAESADPYSVLLEAILADQTASTELAYERGPIPEHTAERTLESLSPLASATHADVLLTYRKDDDLLAVLVNLDHSRLTVVAAYTIGSVGELASLAEQLRASLGVQGSQRKRAPQRRGISVGKVSAPQAPMERWEDLSARLGAKLFPNSISTELQARRELLVFPAGVLSTMPLSLLRPEGWHELLGDRLSVSILPSISGARGGLFRWLGIDAHDRALVLGNPDLRSITGWQFPNLPGAAREARAVHSAIRGTLLLGPAATSKALRAHMNEEVTILYMATHAIADEDNALDGSYIALSDQLLSAREIQAMRFRSGGLAVLSACQTGLGGVRDGGTIGLARAFQLSGFYGVIMSLWSVDDSATYKLMTGFLDGLRTLPPQAALQAASRNIQKSESDPVKWGAFEYFGFPMLGPSSKRDPVAP